MCQVPNSLSFEVLSLLVGHVLQGEIPMLGLGEGLDIKVFQAFIVLLITLPIEVRKRRKEGRCQDAALMAESLSRTVVRDEELT